MANALPILLLGGAAVLMLAGKKKKNGRGRGDEAPEPPEAPSEQVAFDEQNFVNIAFDTKPQYVHLGNVGITAKVSGVDDQGFVYPLANETLANWYARVAYWGAYPQNTNQPQFAGSPYEIPPQCMAPDLAKTLGVPCHPNYIPYRDALLRIYGLVMAEGRKRGMNMDARMGSQA